MIKRLSAMLTAVLMIFAICGCGSQESVTGLDDGTYTVLFTTDNPGMFHVNESLDDKATLTVKDGVMTVHVTLQSKKIVNLYPGMAEDAKKDKTNILQPVEDEVTYSDGYKETVYGFDVPVPSLDEEFDLALLGTKGKWYDHKVVVSSPVEESKDASDAKAEATEGDTVNVDFAGGTGRTTVESPAPIKLEGDQYILTLTFSSPNYDYVIIGSETFYPVNEEGNSTFELPIPALDEEFTIIADTVAMSEPHEIEYTLKCYK